ncbi:DNA polymerase III, epsilon subunit [human gut metagenome]|uniref:DNA polymerase III, epsilon subunit n=1 Tax=human gut metagenome TaxID=408170 RepID=W1Y7U6_9ZZZZ
MIIHLVTGPRKGIIVNITDLKLINSENERLQQEKTVIEQIAINAFNKVTNSEIISYNDLSKYYANTYDEVQYFNNKQNFNLMKNLTEYSLNHKVENYIFTDESYIRAERDVRKKSRVISISLNFANSKNKSIVSLGYVVEENSKIIHENNIFINPEDTLTKAAQKKYNLVQDDLLEFKTWPNALKEILSYITPNTLIIGHNIRVNELPSIRSQCKRYNIEIPEFAQTNSKNNYDITRLSKTLYKYLNSHTLESLCKEFHISVDINNTLSKANAIIQLFNTL